MCMILASASFGGLYAWPPSSHLPRMITFASLVHNVLFFKPAVQSDIPSDTNLRHLAHELRVM